MKSHTNLDIRSKRHFWLLKSNPGGNKHLLALSLDSQYMYTKISIFCENGTLAILLEVTSPYLLIPGLH